MILGVIAAVCFALASALLLRLHVMRTRLNPIRDAVSDYGTTAVHRNYRAMVIAFGIGAVLLAIALADRTNAKNLFWLWIYGGSRIAIAGFMTDRDPPPFTTEGRVHWLLAGVAFTAIAFAASDISWHGAPGILRPLGYAVAATAVLTLVTRIVRPLRLIFGLMERLLYVTGTAWLLIASIAVAS